MSNQKLAEIAIEKGLSTVVLLEGKAPEQHNDTPVTISGNIDAPSRFIDGEKERFKESKKHALVSKTDGKIKLIINEQSVVDKYEITGQIEVSKKFKELGINKEQGYTPVSLANKFKLLRSIFVSNLEHSQICATLRNLKAKINKDIEKADDRKGNVTDNFRQTVESNMPDAIKLQIPLLEGENPVEIEVNIVLEASGTNDIVCYLESVDVAEMIEELFTQRVDEEVEKIQDFVTVIFY